MPEIRIKVQSPAKINWNLRVLGKREDGFHEIESLVSPVGLFDELVFEGTAEPGFELRCDNPAIPCDQGNLIWRSAALLGRLADRQLRLRCRLTKRIPIGGGLGGGSSNAAATLKALNDLWSLNWPVERLMPLAAELGSDVALFLSGGSAIISGRGERIRPVELGWRGWVVLLMPGFEISTPAVYKAWRPSPQASQPTSVDQAAMNPAAVDAVAWIQRSFNMLAKPAIEVCPRLGQLLDGLTKLAGRPVRVSGSGSTMFTAFDDKVEAERFADDADKLLGVESAVVRPIEQMVEVKSNS